MTAYNILEGKIAVQIEITPVTYEGQYDCFEACREADADCFGVYLRDSAGEAVHIADFDTSEAALQFCKRFKCIDEYTLIKKDSLR